MVISNKDELVEITNRFSDIIVYGGKANAENLVYFLEEHLNFPKDSICVAVSNINDNLSLCRGHYIISIDSCLRLNNSCAVLIAASEKFREEMLLNAQSLGFENVYVLDDNGVFLLAQTDSQDRIKKALTDECLAAIQEVQNEVLLSNPHPSYDDLYHKIELGYWYSLAQYVYNLACAKKKAFNKCLDIGGGHGTWIVYLSKLFNSKIYCVDITDTFISKKITDNHEVTFAKNQIELEPFPWDIKYDLIVLTEVMEHFNCHPLPALKKIRDLLEQDGLLLLSTPNVSAWGKLDFYETYNDIPMPNEYSGQSIKDRNGHVYQYSEQELEELFLQAGLAVVEKFVHRHLEFVLERSESERLVF